MHPIFLRLIEVKWGFFGKRAWLEIFLNVLLTVAYTVLGITHPTNAKGYYFPLSKNSWRIPLEVLVVILTFNEIRKEVKEFYQSRRESKKFITWRKKEIKRDLQYSHPRWTQEERYIKQHVRQIKERKRFYFQDIWNYLDWMTYMMLLIVIILHVINVAVQSNKYNDVFIRIHAFTVILMWVRLLQFARPFPTQGPFVVILNNILGDTIRWGFVIAMFYIPYAAAFWMLFGGRSEHPVKGYDTVYHLAYTIIRYPLVDNYGFDHLENVAPIMARVLCGSFLIIAAIILMNLYIALLSNTFQRVYDNARATAAMQRARLLQDLESDASDKTVRRYREHIRTISCPEERDYLVIISNEEDQERKEKEKIDLVHAIVDDRLGGKKFGKVQKSEFDEVLEDIDIVKRSQEEMEKSFDRLFVRLRKIESLESVNNEELATLKATMEEKFGSLVSGVDLRFETLEAMAKIRKSALESNINTWFDQLEIQFKNVTSRFVNYEQEMTARVEDLEAYIVSVEEDKAKEKSVGNVGKDGNKKKGESSNLSGFQIVDANRGVVKSAAILTSKAVGDDTKVTDVDKGEDDSTERQRRRNDTLAGQATSKAAGDGAKVSDIDKSERDSIERQRRRNIRLAGQAARDEYIARLKESLTKTAGESDTEKDKED